MQTYNRDKAVQYAIDNWNKRNENFYNFDNLGGDCTNFINQCLFAGGFVMNLNVSLGWFYKSLNYRSASWSGVNEFFYFAINNKSNTGVKAKVVDLNDVEIGDVIQLRQNPARFNHSLLVTKVERKNGFLTKADVFVTTHTNDAVNKSLLLYNFEGMRCLKIHV